MKKTIVLLFVTLSLLGCKNKEQKTEDLVSKETRVLKEVTLECGCYVFDDGKNSLSLEVTENKGNIKGNLDYALFEKDKNSGVFTGQLKDGILIGNYNFQSEGKESTRAVAFKVDGTALIEGYGELNEEGTAFKNINSLRFSSQMPLTKTDCAKMGSDCLFENGKVFSTIEQNCLELARLKIKLNPLKDGAMTEGSPAYLLFNETQSKVEVFLPKSNKGMVLEQLSPGNWAFGNYRLQSWKGYVLQEKGLAVFGG